MFPSLTRYFRHHNSRSSFSACGRLSGGSGYFQFGPDAICYGRSSRGFLSEEAHLVLHDASNDVSVENGIVKLPFDPSEVIENLRMERYAIGCAPHQSNTDGLIRDAYSVFRPLLPLALRKHLHRIYFSGWRKLRFPVWPVDRTVDRLFQEFLMLEMEAAELESMPFIWFWPNGAEACAIMTHDVETEQGKKFCPDMMDVDEQFGMPASFQIVPEKRYSVEQEFLESMRRRGFEVNVQDLDHDGKLFRDKDEFERRVKRINWYGNEYEALGFRSAILYRNQGWYDSLKFEYDMSVPNVAHLDPQRGGCCTVMPYFVGNLLELPVTTTQDHSLFHILNDFTIDLWREQSEIILEQNGLMSFIVHPDYMTNHRARDTYRSLLMLLTELRSERNVWLALPGDVNRWWRHRDQMNLAYIGGKWSIQGPGSERAKVAFATVENGQLVYTFADEPSGRATRLVSRSVVGRDSFSFRGD